MRILFVTATRIGDAVLSTGLLGHLLDRHPEARLTIACGPVAAPLFEAVPNLERVIVLHKKAFSLHWLNLWATCVGTVWDLVVDLRRAPLTRLLAARDRRHLGRNRDLTHRVVKLAGVLGLADDPPAPRLWTADAHERTAERLIPDGAPVLAVGPATNWPVKTWPAERFAALLGRLTDAGGILPGCRIALFGQEEERPSVLTLIESIPEDRRVDLIGRVSLPEAFACLRRCAFYVGNDSGLMHVAAAADLPTLGLFGPSREEHYAPWGPKGAAIRADASFDEIFPPGFDHRTSESLMEGLGVDRVEAAARDLWRRTGNGA